MTASDRMVYRGIGLRIYAGKWRRTESADPNAKVDRPLSGLPQSENDAVDGNDAE